MYFIRDDLTLRRGRLGGSTSQPFPTAEMNAQNRILIPKRCYRQWAANKATERFSLTDASRRWFKWSNARVMNTALGVVAFLGLEAVDGAITLQKGLVNSTWASFPCINFTLHKLLDTLGQLSQFEWIRQRPASEPSVSTELGRPQSSEKGARLIAAARIGYLSEIRRLLEKQEQYAVDQVLLRQPRRLAERCDVGALIKTVQGDTCHAE